MSRIPEVLCIFRKDLTVLAWRAAAFIALVAVLARQDAALPAANNTPWYAGWLDPIFFLACFYVIQQIIHAEGPAGPCPYWLTRPLSRGGIVIAKALVLVALLHFPLLTAQAWSMATNGVSPLDHWPILLWRQVFFAARVVLPAAALAAVTSSSRGFAIGAAVYLAISALPVSDWAGFAWSRASIQALLAAAGAGIALVLAYSRRKITPARGALVNAAVLILLWQLLSWRTGFAIQRSFSGEAPANLARIVFAPSRPAPPLTFDPGKTRPDRMRLALPVEIAGIPADQGARVEGLRTTIDAHRRNWDSGWTRASNPDGTFLSADGPQWLALDVPVDLYERIKDIPVDLRVSLALTLPGDSTSRVLDLDAGRDTKEGGVCWAHPAGAFILVVCSSPSWRASRSRMRVQSHSTGQTVTGELSPDRSGALNYGGFPTGSGISLWKNSVAGSVSTPPFPISIIVDADPPASVAERTVEARGIRLASFVIPARRP